MENVNKNSFIDNFSNNIQSEYSISSDDNQPQLSEGNIQMNIIENKRNEEFVFYNNYDLQNENNEENSDFDMANIEKSYFTSNELNQKKEDIIKLFNIFDVIIFTDDIRINIVSRTGYRCFFSRKEINPNEFPGILFLSFGSINLVKNTINKHNKTIVNTESETDKNKHNYQICFDEGDIFKNMVYKKLQIQNKLVFVPMNKYQLKLTEYKLRGFCQIMEELGAIEIEIEFNNVKIESKKKNVKIESSDYNYIAGSLGFSASDKTSDNEGINYNLIYPKNNTFILNSKVIKKKIMNGKYIISKKNFDSNLELQYIIESRCRHFITNYSTVFTLDNSISYDLKLIGKLESHNFNLGFETNNEVMKNLKLSINTKVKFCEQKDASKNLLGDNVSWDSIGFNYLLGTLEKDTFETEGIYKIIFFINKYIDKVIYYKNKKYYDIIKKIYKIMNIEFSFDEYKDLLLSYFTYNSHWLHFLNFIDVLVFKSVSYDKLGFLILMSQTDLPIYKKNLKIINFIKHIATINKIEDQFWEMLEPNNYYVCTNKLNNTYNLLSKFNWFNLERLIYDMKKYKTSNFIESNLEYEDLYNNFILGDNLIQFDKFIKPYIINFINENFIEKLNRSEHQFTKYIFNIVQARHLKYYTINTKEKLLQFINNKFNQLDEAQEFLIEVLTKIKQYEREDIGNKNSDLYKNLFPLIQCVNFKDRFPYISRKLLCILEDNADLDNFFNFCKRSNMDNNMLNFCINIIKKLILFNCKFDINRLDLTEIGFNSLLNFIKLDNNDNAKKMKIDFFLNFCNFVISQKLSDNILSNIELSNDIEEEIFNCYEFNKLVDICCNYLNKKYNLNIETDFYTLLKS